MINTNDLELWASLGAEVYRQYLIHDAREYGPKLGTTTYFFDKDDKEVGYQTTGHRPHLITREWGDVFGEYTKTHIRPNPHPVIQEINRIVGCPEEVIIDAKRVAREIILLVHDTKIEASIDCDYMSTQCMFRVLIRSSTHKLTYRIYIWKGNVVHDMSCKERGGVNVFVDVAKRDYEGVLRKVLMKHFIKPKEEPEMDTKRMYFLKYNSGCGCCKYHEHYLGPYGSVEDLALNNGWSVTVDGRQYYCPRCTRQHVIDCADHWRKFDVNNMPTTPFVAAVWVRRTDDTGDYCFWDVCEVVVDDSGDVIDLTSDTPRGWTVKDIEYWIPSPPKSYEEQGE